MMMKKTIISGLLCLATVYTFGQDVCRYYSGEKVCYEISSTRMLVKTKTLDFAGLEMAIENQVTSHLKTVYELGDKTFVIEMENTSRADMWALQRQLSAWEDVIYISPIFGDYPGAGYANELFVTLKSKDNYPALLKYAGDHPMEDIIASPYLHPETYRLTLPHNAEKDAMQTALELYETGLLQHAEPNIFYLCPFGWCPFGPEPESGSGTKHPLPTRFNCITAWGTDPVRQKQQAGSWSFASRIFRKASIS
jgi:hypothetical protein